MRLGAWSPWPDPHHPQQSNTDQTLGSPGFWGLAISLHLKAQAFPHPDARPWCVSVQTTFSQPSKRDSVFWSRFPRRTWTSTWRRLRRRRGPAGRRRRRWTSGGSGGRGGRGRGRSPAAGRGGPRAQRDGPRAAGPRPPGAGRRAPAAEQRSLTAEGCSPSSPSPLDTSASRREDLSILVVTQLKSVID